MGQMLFSFDIWIVSLNLTQTHFLVLKQNVEKLSINKDMSSNLTEAQKTSCSTKWAYSGVGLGGWGNTKTFDMCLGYSKAHVVGRVPD